MSNLNLREKRKQLKLSLRALATLVGVSRQTILDYEKDKYAPATTEIWKRLKEALHLEGNFRDWFTMRKRGRPKKFLDDSDSTPS